MGKPISLPIHGQTLVGILDLRLARPVETGMTRFLSAEERSRAGRFVFSRDRSRFVATRGFLRLMLASCLGVEPGLLTFSYGACGKPRLEEARWNGHKTGLSFNVSHSDDFALFAVGWTELGVDIERIREIEDMAELVRRFFSAEEFRLFSRLPLHARARAFFNLWTRKEALLKATGEGIAHNLNRVQVEFLEGEEVSIRALPTAFGRLEEWSLKDLAVPNGFAGAIAARCSEIRVQYFPAFELLREHFDEIAPPRREGALV